MALDGAFLHHIRKELTDAALEARVEKIYQPNQEEIVLLLRTYTDHFKLLLSARANSARIHFTRFVPENPPQPPMLCMLMRKRLQGARLSAVEQPGLERVLRLVFDAVNELGDHVALSLYVEIMGRYSNIIFVDENGKIIDALKRVDAEMTSERLVLPGLRYELPPPQDKLCALEVSPAEAADRIRSMPPAMPLSKAVLSSLQGVSPIVAREVAFHAARGTDPALGQMGEEHWLRLPFFLDRLFTTVREVAGVPHMAVKPDGKPLDFTFFPIEQYGLAAIVRKYGTCSELLDAFYDERDRIDRMRVRSQDLLRLLANASERLSNKINKQRAELDQCARRDELRLNGELISANLYRLEKGAFSAKLENFYEEGMPLVEVPMDPLLTPSQNAQKYFKEYRKARTAEEKLTEQISQAEEELAYLDTVFEELSRAETERDLSEIRQELVGQGYIRPPRGKQRRAAGPAAPLRFRSTGGFLILVGRNNRQNDQLTMKQANNRDLWFHTKNIPGSHTILVTEGREPGEQDVREAAMLAAWHSRGRDSAQVPVDYTQVRNVSKPNGAKPGMVIYTTNSTLYVTPEKDLAERLAEPGK